MTLYMQEQDLKPPETVKELGIHFGYLREDVQRLTKMLEDGTYAKSKDVADLAAAGALVQADFEKRISSLEHLRDKLVYKVAGWAIVGLALMVLALYGLDKFFK